MGFLLSSRLLVLAFINALSLYYDFVGLYVGHDEFCAEKMC